MFHSDNESRRKFLEDIRGSGVLPSVKFVSPSRPDLKGKLG